MKRGRDWPILKKNSLHCFIIEAKSKQHLNRAAFAFSAVIKLSHQTEYFLSRQEKIQSGSWVISLTYFDVLHFNVVSPTQHSS